MGLNKCVVMVFGLFYLTSLLAMPAYGAPQHGISLFNEKLKYQANFTHFDYVNASAPKGGDVKLVANGTFDNLNSHILKGIPAAGLGYIYDTLMAKSDDEVFSQYGLVAESLELAADKKSITFYLRKSTYFHDGEPITADDVVFSFYILTSKGHPFYRSYYGDISGAEKINKHTVKFTFKNADNRELALIIGDLPILPKHYWERAENDFRKTTLTPPLGSGAYKIDSLSAGKYIKYSRVKNYWGKDLAVNKGRYNFDSIKYDYYRDATVAVEAFKAGEYDFRHENISKIWANSYNIPKVENGEIIREEIRHEVPTGMQAFVFNLRKDKFKDREIRKALNYVFDFEWTNKTLFHGAYTRTKSYFSNSIYASSGTPSNDELNHIFKFKSVLPKEVFDQEFTLPTTDSSGNNRKNLRTAKELIKNAGEGDSKWRMKDSLLQRPIFDEDGALIRWEKFEIEFLINAGGTFERVILPISIHLKKLGIKATIRAVDASQYIKRIEDFDFDIVVDVFSQGLAPGNEQIDYWHSSSADIRGGRNIAGVKNKAVDYLVNEVIVAKSQSELIAATHALDRVLLNGYYIIPNWHIRNFRVIYWNKFDKPKISPKYNLGFDNWWIKAK